MDHVAEEDGPVAEFQHLRVGLARALFSAAGPALAERLMVAAPVIPHHAGAVADLETAAGKAEAARLSRDVYSAVLGRDPDMASAAVVILLRRHQQRAGILVAAEVRPGARVA